MSERGRLVRRGGDVSGVVIPIFVDEATFSLRNLAVYADGLIHEGFTLNGRKGFLTRLRAGELRPSIPNGRRVRVHGLGAWTVRGGRWLTVGRFHRLVIGWVRTLNPALRRLAADPPQQTGRIIRAAPRPVPVRQTGDSPDSLAVGRSRPVFCREPDGVYLAELRVFEDGAVEIGRLPEARTLDCADLEAQFSGGRLLTTASEGQRVIVHPIGSFVVDEQDWSVEPDDVVAECADLLAALNGRPTSSQRCLAALRAYAHSPDEPNRAALRDAYEAVPKHLRRYLGDMDTKDIPIRMILYGRAEIEQWSHRIVAREAGMSPLPDIRVPPPPGESDEGAARRRE